MHPPAARRVTQTARRRLTFVAASLTWTVVGGVTGA